MSKRQKQRLYYVQIPEDFFTRHPHDMVGDDEEGQLVLLCYTKLLVEAIHHEGRLRFSETTPFTARTLARKFRLREETVDRSLSVLRDLELLTVEDDGTIVVPEFWEYVGSISYGGLQRAATRRMSASVNGQTGGSTDAKKECKSSVERPTSVDVSQLTEVESAPALEDTSIADEPPIGRLRYGKPKDAPTIEDVLKVARRRTNNPTMDEIPEDFAREWYSIMCGSDWIDTNGKNILCGSWQTKLRYAWSDEKKRRKERDDGKSDSGAGGKRTQQSRGSFYFEGIGAASGI